MARQTLFDDGFPETIRNDYEHVISLLYGKENAYVRMSDAYNSENEIYILSDSTRIRFPYRIYCADDDHAYSQLNDQEKLIFDCIFTRNSDGHIREKHIRNILKTELPEWCFPYIVRSSADYVAEIVSTIYDCLKQRENRQLQTFCRNNTELVQTNYRRMYSYWYEYCRNDFPIFRSYVGRKLFSECLNPDCGTQEDNSQDNDYGSFHLSSDELTYTYKGTTYRLSSHPYEPCLYLFLGDQLVCVLHNAYTVEHLVNAFSAGKPVKTCFGKNYDKEYDEAAFCRILAAVLDSGHVDLDFFDAAELAKKESHSF